MQSDGDSPLVADLQCMGQRESDAEADFWDFGRGKQLSRLLPETDLGGTGDEPVCPRRMVSFELAHIELGDGRAQVDVPQRKRRDGRVLVGHRPPLVLPQELDVRFDPVLCKCIAGIPQERAPGKHIARRRRERRVQVAARRGKILLLPFVADVIYQVWDLDRKLPRLPGTASRDMQRLSESQNMCLDPGRRAQGVKVGSVDGRGIAPSDSDLRFTAPTDRDCDFGFWGDPWRRAIYSAGDCIAGPVRFAVQRLV